MKKIIQGLCCILLVATIAGCGLTSKQIVKTQSFGMATSNIGNFGEEEFVNIRNGIIEMNKELVSIDNTKMANSLKFDKPASEVILWGLPLNRDKEHSILYLYKNFSTSKSPLNPSLRFEKARNLLTQWA